MEKYSVVMAGGGGTRFWPLSRQDIPKQLLNLSGNDIMINETIKRCENLIPVEKTFIVTNKQQADKMDSSLLQNMPRSNILIEPVGRNTAPCILFAAMHIYEKYGDGVICVFPSDHIITNSNKFLEALEIAIQIAAEVDTVLTLGIKPTYPSTGYGYIKSTGEPVHGRAYRLERFVEKPNLEWAREYLRSGQYYWNSGIFIWKVSVILKLFQRFLPRIHNGLKEIEGKFCGVEAVSLLERIYPSLDSISVDYGILERLDEALVMPVDFGWNDVGSWDTLGSIFPADDNGNILKAEHLGIDTKESIIYGGKKLIATIGIYNTVIVDTDDALLICSRERSQDVKYIVDHLREHGKTELL